MDKLSKEERAWVEHEMPSYAQLSATETDIHVCYSRIAYLFGIEPEKIKYNFRFGQELDASFYSDFERNELDRLYYDVEELELILYPKKNDNIIETVKDFVALFIQCKESQCSDDLEDLVYSWVEEYLPS